jgi:hypothetical protein
MLVTLDPCDNEQATVLGRSSSDHVGWEIGAGYVACISMENYQKLTQIVKLSHF